MKKIKNCAICEEQIIHLPGKPKRTRYCSEICAQIAMKKYQAFYRKCHG